MNEEEELELERRIGYSFHDKNLLVQAVTHSSYANENHMKPLSDNERLEFLGDAVLELVSSEFLYQNYPKDHEGELSKLRASLVCEPTLSYCSDEFGLDAFLRLSHGEEKTGGRKRKSIKSDALEAVIGAIFLDGGLAPAKKFILRFILTDIEHKRLFHDSKTALQEIVQARHGAPLTYELLKEEGPDHNRHFTIAAKVGDEVVGTGEGRSKKAAEQEAAYQGILYFHGQKK